MTGADTASLLLHEVEVDGAVTSVRVADGIVTQIAPGLVATADDDVIDGGGGALVPGLHDHHLHLASMAAADRSVHLEDADLDGALRAADAETPPGAWLRFVGYDDGRHGALDRVRLDRLAPDRAVRVQHRSGALWVLSTPALAELGLLDGDLDGLERDPSGAPTGRLFRLDDWLGAHLPAQEPPDVAAVARRLARFGVTGVTDATPVADPAQLALLATPDLVVGVVATGGPALVRAEFPSPLDRGPVKLVVADHVLPDLDDLASAIRDAHTAGRPVAVHCVTRVALALAVAAWDAAGAAEGDRVEHGAVVPADLAVRLVELGLTVVTQPGFVRARGDRYLTDVDPEDRAHLYPCASLLAAGIPVGGSTDAPFGPEDPWVAIAAAIDRRTSSGRRLGPDEAVEPARALALFQTGADAPGGAVRRVAVGAPADLCLLDRRLAEVLADPSSDRVRATFRAGRTTYRR